MDTDSLLELHCLVADHLSKCGVNLAEVRALKSAGIPSEAAPSPKASKGFLCRPEYCGNFWSKVRRELDNSGGGRFRS